ncbi:MAG: ATP-grasp domain-containing protein [Planctomycetia bacterium]|nr:ATP-grasp domain-containing protein [Planctomycetia bacterium]
MNNRTIQPKKLLILAAGELQTAAIITARKMGVYVIAADGSATAPGLALADRAEVFNITDIPTCVRFAVENKIDGVLHICSEVSMLSVGAINDSLGLFGPGLDVARQSTNKGLMRKAFEKAKAPSPYFAIVTDWKEAETFLTHFPEKVVYKPSRNSASRGVTVLNVNSPIQEHQTAFEYALTQSRDQEVVMEEFMEGPEFSVEILCWNNEPHVLTITDKITSGAPHFVELGHTQPTRRSKMEAEQIKEAALQGVKALGIDWSAAHAEIKLTAQDAKIVEIGPRLGGDFITTDLVGLSTGIDMVEGAIRLALGEIPDLVPKHKTQGAAIRFLQQPSKLIESVDGIETAKSMPGVYRCFLDIQPGLVGKELRSSLDRGGYIIALGKDANEAEQHAEDALQKIIIR